MKYDRIYFDYQAECVEAYRVVGNARNRISDNTVVLHDLKCIPSGPMDGMAECVWVNRLGKDSTKWWYLLWREYHDTR